MNIERINKLSKKPELYEKGTSVMWTDPYISKKLLELHINPGHDVASRSRAKIEKITRWILEKSNKPGMKILDLGCGPGLYAEILAERGHQITGIDFSENSIRYAAGRAKEKKLDIQYRQGNYLEVDIGQAYDLVILIYFDFCALIPQERDPLLKKIFRALKPGGFFIFDVVNEKNLDKKIIPQSWDVQHSGFWKNMPYLALNNGYHYPEDRVWANHHLVIGEDDTIDTYIFWNHYYEIKDLVPLLESAGFTDIQDNNKVLPESDDCWTGENVTFYSARKA